MRASKGEEEGKETERMRVCVCDRVCMCDRETESVCKKEIHTQTYKKGQADRQAHSGTDRNV